METMTVLTQLFAGAYDLFMQLYKICTIPIGNIGAGSNPTFLTWYNIFTKENVIRPVNMPDLLEVIIDIIPNLGEMNLLQLTGYIFGTLLLVLVVARLIKLIV